MTAPVVPTVKLTHGAQIPVLGLGTWPMDDEQAARVIPQAATSSRLLENLAVFDWELSAQDLGALSSLDRGESAVVDSDEFGH